MNDWLITILGLFWAFFGFRMYNYFNKNINTIDNQPGKLYAIAVIVIISGAIITLIPIINWMK